MSTTKAATTATDNPVNKLRDQIVSRQEMFAAALPEHIKPERFVRVVLTAVLGDPDLMDADRASLFEASLRCAQDGLLPNKFEAALVVFSTKVKRGGRDEWIKKVQYMPMVYGILKKVRNSGDLSTISAELVYQHDHFRVLIDGEGKHVEFEPKVFEDRGKFLGVFAIAKMKDGSIDCEVMSVADIDRVKACSKSPDKGPWATWYYEKARAACLKRLAKRLPQSAERALTAAIAATEIEEDHPPSPRPRLSDFSTERSSVPALEYDDAEDWSADDDGVVTDDVASTES